MICIVTYVIGCLFQLYIYMLFFCRQSKSHGLLAAIRCVILVFAHISDYGHVCRVSHTYCSVEPFPLCCAIKAAKRDLQQQGPASLPIADLTELSS